MSRIRLSLAVAGIGGVCLFLPLAQSQPNAERAVPAAKLEPVADTKLIMEGLAKANLRGLATLLRDKPEDAEAWGFARGQALLIGETGNLLLLRPPRAEGRDAWQTHATDLRESATALARAAAARDYPSSRAALAGVANVCNRCHTAFRIPHRVDPFAAD